MPQVSATIRLENSLRVPVRVVEVAAQIDPEAHHLCLPATVVTALGLKATGIRSETTPEGLAIRCRYVGPITLQLGQAQAFVGALEFGDRVTLGNIPMAALALMLDPSTGELVDDPRASRIS